MNTADALRSLAALQQVAIPTHRFQTTGDDAPSVSEAWLAVFPKGKVKPLKGTPTKDQYPLLWVDDQQTLVVTGRNAQGLYLTVGQQVHALGPGQGEWLRLTTGRVAGDAHRSATAMFRAALFQRKGVLVEAGLATLVINLLALVTSLYTMQVYDRVVPTGSQSTLWVLTFGVGIALVFDFILKQVRTLLVDRASVDMDIGLSQSLFERALNIRLDSRPKTIGTFAAQLKHFESVRQFMTASSLFVLADAPFALLFVVFIASLAPALAWIPLVGLGLALLAGLLFTRPIEKAVNAHMLESNQKSGLLVDAIDGAEAVQASGAEWKVGQKHAALSEAVATSDYKLRRINSLSSSVSQTVQQLHYVVIVAFGSLLIVSGELTMGALIAISIISGRAFAPITQLPGLIIQWKHAAIAVKALDVMTSLPSNEPDQKAIVPDGAPEVLSIDRVVFAFSGSEQTPALNIQSLSISGHERVAIVGSIGSGKSTLLRIMAGLYKPTSGTAYLDQVDISQIAPGYLREQLGLLPQDVRLFEGTLRDNLTLGIPTPTDTQLLESCKGTGLIETVNAHPKGLDRPIYEGGRGLSGGQRQLLGLTRLLLAKPAFMLLDEPTASMDSSLERRVMGALFSESGQGVVMVTHKLSVLPSVDRIIVLDKGRVLLDGPRDEVMAKLRNAAEQAK